MYKIGNLVQQSFDKDFLQEENAVLFTPLRNRSSRGDRRYGTESIYHTLSLLCVICMTLQKLSTTRNAENLLLLPVYYTLVI